MCSDRISSSGGTDVHAQIHCACGDACMCTSNDMGLVNPFKDRNTDITEQPVVVVREVLLPRERKEK